jgi:hypothetical protein
VFGTGSEHGLEFAAGIELGVGLDGHHPDDAWLGLGEGEELERRMRGAELSGPVVVVGTRTRYVCRVAWAASGVSCPILTNHPSCQCLSFPDHRFVQV